MTAAIMALVAALAGAIGAIMLLTRRLVATNAALAMSESRRVQMQDAKEHAERAAREAGECLLASTKRYTHAIDEFRTALSRAREQLILRADGTALRKLLDDALGGAK